VTIPPAWKLDDKVAASVMELPTGIELADSVVVMVGLAILTVKGSQTLVAAPLFASPLYAAFQLAVRAELNV
jgi:hypothetical protein